MNLVFHKVLSPTATAETIYELPIMYFTELLSLLGGTCAANRCSTIRLYFDDNHRETLYRVAPLLANTNFERVIAVHTDSVGRAGHCSGDELRRFQAVGFRIASHGVSHAALAVYHSDILQETPPGGIYRNAPAGRTRVLSEQEVAYQLVESKRALAGFQPSEFVLPYGLYNDQTVLLNTSTARYAHIGTCDVFLDSNELLRPRCLITGDRTVTETIRLLNSMVPREGVL